MRLSGQIAIVTGAGQGIVQQIALRLAEEGAMVVIADINGKGSIETQEMISRNYGKKSKVIPTDITHEEQVVAMVNGSLEIDDRIEILVNNSGIAGPIKNIEDITLEEWEATMSVNLRGMFLCCKHVVPVMKKQEKGNIINISSVVGKLPLAQRTPYASSKMGVIGFTRTLAAEVGKWKIRVNAICPGQVIGARFNRVLEGIVKYSGKSWDEIVAEQTNKSNLKSFVEPKYIGATVAFLCSEDSAMITGEDIDVSGGNVSF